MAPWAEKYVGIPYLLHARSMRFCDCYGLVCLIYKQEFNIELPLFDEEYNKDSNSAHILGLFEDNLDRFTPVSRPVAGDLVYLLIGGLEKHVGVIVGDNMFVHNLCAGGSSTLAELYGSRWKRRLLGFYRYE